MGLEIKKSDATLKQDVIRELKWDTRVHETQIGVEAKGGIITLSGVIENYAEKLAAQEAAHRVAGVLDVANNLQLKVPGLRTDADIAQAVRRTLEWDVMVPAEKIKSTVSDGVVTLEGEVDYWSQLEDAARCIRNLAGVRTVINNLSIKPHHAELPEVRSAIEDALERRAERQAQHISLAVTDGLVTVSGRVQSWTEKQTVLGAVKGTPGVRSVKDDLRIAP